MKAPLNSVNFEIKTMQVATGWGGMADWKFNIPKSPSDYDGTTITTSN